jgi:hypothetical protein
MDRSNELNAARRRLLKLDLAVDRDVQPDLFARKRHPGGEGFVAFEFSASEGVTNDLFYFALCGRVDTSRGLFRRCATAARFENTRKEQQLCEIDGGRDRDRTCDPYHVKVVLFR